MARAGPDVAAAGVPGELAQRAGLELRPLDPDHVDDRARLACRVGGGLDGGGALRVVAVGEQHDRAAPALLRTEHVRAERGAVPQRSALDRLDANALECALALRRGREVCDL